jgi:Na+/H+-dicarboxylate symporter
VTLTVRILIAMGLGLVLGSVIKAAGLDADHWIQSILIGDVIDAGGQIFVRSLQLMVVPLVFVSLVCGAASLGDTGSMGRVAGKAVGLYLLTTAIAISIAVLLALLVQPGVGVSPMELQSSFEPSEPASFKDTLVNIFPTNPVEAMAQGNMLQIILFALLLGVALSHSGEAGSRVTGFFQDLNEVLMNLITMLIRLAPYGVFCLMTELFATLGLAEITRLLQYFFTVVGALLIHAAVVYPGLLMLLGRVSPVRFFLKMREPMLVAFSTASSSATLPVTLRTVEERLGVKNEVAAFTVPLGATINMDGTAIMQGVATVFIAQLYGIELGLSQYLMVILTATMASIGTAGVPGVGMIMLVMVLEQVGLPLEGIVFILAVDRLLDMLRTAVNVSGDGMVSTVVARSEDDLEMSVFEDPDAGRVVAEDD